jgi:gentisate 1,2-dioxygenase
MSELGTLEELPIEYRNGLTANNLVPLWPNLRAALPYQIPTRRTQPMVWRYADIRPRLLQAGELTPIEKAERRVLVLANPGLGLDNMQATPSIYIGMQLILPQETAPNHRHSPSAVRFVVEGEGGFTVVEGEKLPMEKGDLILTPSKLWHEHGHEGTGPVVWLDALDLPIVYSLEASYCLEGAPQTVHNQPDASQTRYRRSGLVPYRSLDAARAPYPLRRFPWKETRAALLDLATVTDSGEIVQLAYVNPETGLECLPVLGFSAIMLRPGEAIRPARRSASAVLHVVEGAGQARIDGVTLDWSGQDTIAVPTHARVEIVNRSTKTPSFLFQVDDAPMQRKLGFFEEFTA